jgi:hypothetical protein
VPGDTRDKMACYVLLYHLPPNIRQQAESLDYRMKHNVNLTLRSTLISFPIFVFHLYLFGREKRVDDDMT